MATHPDGFPIRADSSYAEKPRGHVWKLDENGDIDHFGVEWDEDQWRGHNGPICTVCGYSFCHHCQADPNFDCPGRPMTDSERIESWK